MSNTTEREALKALFCEYGDAVLSGRYYDAAEFAERAALAATPAQPVAPLGKVSDLFPALRRVANERGIPDDADLFASQP